MYANYQLYVLTYYLSFHFLLLLLCVCCVVSRYLYPILAQAGEYMNFRDSPGGRATSATKLTPRDRRKRALFGQFLENGNKGFLNGKIMLLEWVGLALSPVTGTLHVLSSLYRQLGMYLWSNVKSCAGQGAIRAAIDEANQRRHADRSSGNSGGGGGTPKASAYGRRISSAPPLTSKHKGLWPESPYSLRGLCELVLLSDLEGSPVANALSPLDVTRYSLFMTVTDVWGELLAGPMWYWSIIAHAPGMYFDYYLTGRGSKLPPRRQSCLLRTAIEVSHREMGRLQERIAAQQLVIQQAEAPVRRVQAAGAGAAGRDKGNRQRRRKGSGKHGSKDEAGAGTGAGALGPAIDFGPEGGMWESMMDKCLEADFGDHAYSFCYFGEIMQDKQVSLGRFVHWGAVPVKQTPGVGSLEDPSAKFDVSALGDVQQDSVSASAGVISGRVGKAGDSYDGVEDSDKRDLTEEEEAAATTIGTESGFVAAGVKVLTSAFSSLTQSVMRSSKFTGATPEMLSAIRAVRTFLGYSNPDIGAIPIGKNARTAAAAAAAAASRANSPETRRARAEIDAFNKKYFNLSTPEQVQRHYSQQQYDGGAGCYPLGGAPRRASVELQCGMHSAITDVQEESVRT
jgi:hypothetical protein